MDFKLFLILIFPLTFILLVNTLHIETTPTLKACMFSLMILVGYMELKILDEVERHGTI